MKRADVKFLLAVVTPLVISLILFFASTVSADRAGISANKTPDYIPRVTDIKKQEEEAWEQACMIHQYDCSGMERPNVEYEAMDGWGYFMFFARGTVCGGTIFVDASVKGQVFAKYIMIHEYTHAMQCDAGWMKRGHAYRGACERERVAFFNEGVAAIMDKYTDPRVNTWDEIKYAYRCP